MNSIGRNGWKQNGLQLQMWPYDIAKRAGVQHNVENSKPYGITIF